ncbi:MAG: thiamine pyrophosphate-binding protein [Hyphomicrobiaceae bacterium]
MSNSQKRGADWLVQGLANAGVETVFSLSGNQIMPVYDALVGSGIRIIHTRHEASAVYMAEAAAQLTGGVGIALLTAGPGFANGLSAIYSARESESPIVVLSGDSPVAQDGQGAFQELDQCAVARPMVKASHRADNAGRLGHDLMAAIALAKNGRPGPVHLALPDDILREICAEAASAIGPISVPPAAAIDSQVYRDIAASLHGAARPMILAGPAFCRPHWKTALSTVSRQQNVPVVPFESPRGLRAPRLGAFADVLKQSDLIVTLGKPLNFMLGFASTGALDSNCRIIQIEADQHVLQRDRDNHPNRIVQQVHADPAEFITSLAEGPSFDETNGAWHSAVKEAVAYRPADWQTRPAQSGPIGSIAFASAIHPTILAHPDAALIIDGGEIGQWSQAILDSRNAMINGPSGAIGASIPYALAAKAVRADQPVITILGDGTAGFYLAEFETAVREDLPFVAIIGNDAKWNAEHQIQLRDYGADRAHGCTLTPARYDQVVADLGGHGELVTELDAIPSAIERALAANKPACLNVMIDGQAAPTISMKAN